MRLPNMIFCSRYLFLEGVDADGQIIGFPPQLIHDRRLNEAFDVLSGLMNEALQTRFIGVYIVADILSGYGMRPWILYEAATGYQELDFQTVRPAIADRQQKSLCFIPVPDPLICDYHSCQEWIRVFSDLNPPGTGFFIRNFVIPEIFKEILVKYGYSVEMETEYNWTLFKNDAARPIITVPKKGDLLSISIMMEILEQLKMDNKTYFDLLNSIQN